MENEFDDLVQTSESNFKSLVFIITALIVVIGLGLYLFKDKLLEIVEPDHNALAIIKKIENNVSYKKSSELSWDKAINKLGLYSQDSLSTQEKSNATFEYKNGYMLNVEENSLVIIEAPDKDKEGADRMSLNLMKGVVRVKGKSSDNKAFAIKTPKSIIEIKKDEDTSLGIRVNEDKSEDVWVNSGKANVETDGHVSELKQGEHKAFNQKIKVLSDGPETLEFGQSESGGNKKLTARQIQTVILGVQKKIRICYDKASRSLSNKGEVTVGLTIKNTGDVDGVEIKHSSITDSALHQCIKFWLGQAKFPTFEGKTMRAEQTMLFE